MQLGKILVEKMGYTWYNKSNSSENQVRRHNEMKRRIGILTSGGDCPGLNAAIRGVTRAAYEMFDAESSASMTATAV